jgi:hypothetical protein
MIDLLDENLGREASADIQALISLSPVIEEKPHCEKQCRACLGSTSCFSFFIFQYKNSSGRQNRSNPSLVAHAYGENSSVGQKSFVHADDRSKWVGKWGQEDPSYPFLPLHSFHPF